MDTRVLIVEDNADSAECMKLVLESSGCVCEVAACGEEALVKAVEFQPAAVLCDIGLPEGIDGYEVARALRRKHEFNDTLLIALTGYSSEEDQRRARESGYDLHLAKPVDLDMLEQLLRDYQHHSAARVI